MPRKRPTRPRNRKQMLLENLESRNLFSISIGGITKHVQAVDLSMRFEFIA